MEAKQGLAPKLTELESGLITPGLVTDVSASIARGIKCPHFNSTDAEAALFAKHASNLLKPLDGRVLSLIILIIIVISKVYLCWTSLTAKMKR